MKTKLLMIALFIWGFSESMIGQYTLIPDANFENALAAFDDIANDGQVPTANIASLTGINISSLNIANLTGIEDFAALEVLNASSNTVTSLDVSALSNLEILEMSTNNITSVTLPLGSTAMEWLSFANNELESIDVSSFPNLIIASFPSNKLLEMKVNTSVANLFVDVNPNLSCIEVDNVAQANNNANWVKDGGASYNLSCNAAVTTQITNVPALISGAFTATITFSEGVVGFTLSDIIPTNATLSNFSVGLGGAVYSVEVTPSVLCGGEVIIDIPQAVTQGFNSGMPNFSATRSGATIDLISPIAIAQDITVSLDSNGQTIITPSQIDNGSTDNCGISSILLGQTFFDCADLGPNTILMGVIDLAGNQTNTSAVVTVQDTTSPVVNCVGNFTIQLDVNSQATITASDLDNGSADNCGIASISISQSTFDCSEIGANTVVLTATDTSGNISTCATVVTVEDNIPPNTLCQNITMPLDSNGMVLITASDVDAGSSDNCAIASTSLSQTVFDCTDLGANNVILTVTDVNGNTSNCTAVVTIEDLIAPMVSCTDITVSLDVNGAISILPVDIDNGSVDNCDINLSLNQASFTCADLGVNTVILTAIDSSGNSSSCTATVTIEDTTPPDVNCVGNFTVQLDSNGQASITLADIDNGTSDNCGILSQIIVPSVFDCSNIGANTVNYTVIDLVGNSATCSVVVTVEDSIAPNTICQDITVQLDANGMATIVSSDIDAGSSDNCAIASITLSESTFDCTDIGANNVTLTVTDANGNIGTCTAIVTVEDNITPLVVCADITISLDANGLASIVPSDIDNGSTDNCDFTLTSDIASFDCSDIGANTVVLTGVDASGNTTSCSADVTVIDDMGPLIECLDMTVDAASNGFYIVPDFYALGDIVITDNCTMPVTNITQSLTIGSAVAPGIYDVSIFAEDDEGNLSECVFELTVEEFLEVGEFQKKLLTIYPNPTSGKLTLVGISSDIKNAVIEIFDMQGRRVKVTSVENDQFDISELVSGNYLVKVTDNQKLKTFQIIKD